MTYFLKLWGIKPVHFAGFGEAHMVLAPLHPPKIMKLNDGQGIIK